MPRKKLVFTIIIVTILTSCATSNKGYKRPKRKKGKKCDCPSFSEKVNIQEENTYCFT